MGLQDQLFKERRGRMLFDRARGYAFQYIDQIENRSAFPSEAAIARLKEFHEPIPDHPGNSLEILEQLDHLGGPATVAQTGGRYFGFVNGNSIPVAQAVKWLSDIWDQCGGLFLTSPVNAELEAVCESWLKELFQLPDETVAGFVSGTSMANLSALCAARHRLLHNQGWDINIKGLIGSPGIRIIAHRQVHASIRKTLAILGFGEESIEWYDADEQGRADANDLPDLDHTCLVLLQAGNVNTGAFDPFEIICSKAKEAGAWVHIDGAFGLWAEACSGLKYLTQGMQLADSWAVDGHKTLNTPYDSGIVLCRDAQSLIASLQASASYIQHTEQREPILYGPEMSKRSRAIELWSVLKYLGKSGIDEMVTTFHRHAVLLAEGLNEAGFTVLNDVVFNQVLFRTGDDQLTQDILKAIQVSGRCWCGGTTWDNRPAIRFSLCNWATTDDDIHEVIELFASKIR